MIGCALACTIKMFLWSCWYFISEKEECTLNGRGSLVSFQWHLDFAILKVLGKGSGDDYDDDEYDCYCLSFNFAAPFIG